MEKGLFEKYVGSFLTMKQEASGFSPESKTKQSREQYIREYEQHKNIHMNYNNVSSNSGLGTKLF